MDDLQKLNYDLKSLQLPEQAWKVRNIDQSSNKLLKRVNNSEIYTMHAKNFLK